MSDDSLVSVPLAPAEPAAEPERVPQSAARIRGISITVTEDIPGGIPRMPDFTAALLTVIQLAVRSGGRELQLHHVREGYEQEPHVPGESCPCIPNIFRVEPASRLILPTRA